MAEAVAKHWTAADLDRIPETRYPRYEIIHGELIASPGARPRHDMVAARFALHLGMWALPRGGEIYTPGGEHRIADDEVIIGDVVLALPAHLDRADGMFWSLPPDLVVEITGKDKRRRDLVVKRDLYDQFGVGEYWVADLRDSCVLAHRRSAPDAGYDQPVPYAMDARLDSPLLPGFTVPVATLLA